MSNNSEMSAGLSAKWLRCLDVIRNNIGEKSFSTWFEPIRCNEMRENQVVLSVPSHFFCEYIEEHYNRLLHVAVKRVFGEATSIGYRIAVDSTNDIHQEVGDEKPTDAIKTVKVTDGNVAPSMLSGLEGEAPQELDSRLNPNYSFDNFIEGVSNKLVRSVGQSIADTPGQITFNPFFIYGASGVGKTHLVNAIGIRIKELCPAKRVLYVSAHLFLVQYTDSVRQNKFNDFINFYQSVEVLIIDDIQEIAGDSRTKTQNAFFHIFNHLQQTRHQIILTCDRPPMYLEGVEERLLTRFKWGLVAELQRPDSALVKKILLDRMNRNGLSFPAEVVDYLAENATDNIRDIESVINSLLAFSVVDDCDIDMALAKRVVESTIKRESKPITVDLIMECVGKYYNVDIKDICSKSRKQLIAQARQVSMYLAQKHTGLSYSRIGTMIGKRDHSTVLHSCHVVEHRISVDKSFRREIEDLEMALR